MKNNIPSSERRLDGVLHCIAAFFMPSILLFDLYNRNHVENHIVFSHVLILAGALAVVGIFLFLVFRIIVTSTEGALIISLLFWLSFWLFEILLGVAVNYSAVLTPVRFMVLIGVGLTFLALIFRRYKPPFVNMCSVFNILAVSLVGLFMFNFFPGANHEIFLQRVRAEMAFVEDGAEPFYMKRNFLIEPTLPTPDIFWLHLDGMMSLETVEQFWGESQEYLREELSSRGFLVYSNAQLNAGFTYAALPALLSPAFYDSFWNERLAQAETKLTTPRARFLRDELAQVGLSYGRNIVPYYELLAALISRGYEVRVRGLSGQMPHSFEHLTGYSYVAGAWHRFLDGTGDLPELLNLTTPLNVPITERVAVEISHSDYGYEPIANFLWRSLTYTHIHNVWQQDPTIAELDFTAIHVYPLAFEHTAQRMFSFVDAAVEENPNAVIILQSDHGFHANETQEYLLDQGYSLEQVLELTHSVFSAVRIPPEYGGLDAPIAPLNISRELVNRFVGQNYRLLPIN